MSKSRFCVDSDAYVGYILDKETIAVTNTAARDAVENNNNKKVKFKNCPSFIKQNKQYVNK